MTAGEQQGLQGGTAKRPLRDRPPVVRNRPKARGSASTQPEAMAAPGFRWTSRTWPAPAGCSAARPPAAGNWRRPVTKRAARWTCMGAIGRRRSPAGAVAVARAGRPAPSRRRGRDALPAASRAVCEGRRCCRPAARAGRRDGVVHRACLETGSGGWPARAGSAGGSSGWPTRAGGARSRAIEREDQHQVAVAMATLEQGSGVFIPAAAAARPQPSG